MSDFFGYSFNLEVPKQLQVILEETKTTEITGIAASGNNLAIFSNPKKTVLLVNLISQVTKKILIPVDEKLEIKIKNVVWCRESQNILVIIPTSLFVFNSETAEIIASCSTISQQNSFVDGQFYTEDQIISIDEKGGITLYSAGDLQGIKNISIGEEITCFSIYSDILALGTSKGKVILYKINDTENSDEIFFKFDEIRATASNISFLKLTADFIFVSSSSDSVVWSGEKRPLFAVKSRGEIIYSDPVLRFGFSVVNGSEAYMHLIARGSKDETSKRINFEHLSSETFLQPAIQWLNDETIRAIFASQKQIYICSFTKTIEDTQE